MTNDELKKEYPIQDDIWASRRWNKEMTDYVDLSGESRPHVVAPITDEVKEILNDCSIQYLTKDEIIERYGDILTAEQLKSLRT